MSGSHTHRAGDLDAEIVEMLVGDLRCPSCGAAFAAEGVSLTFSPARAIELSCQCGRCGTGSLMTISMHDASLSAELTPGEAFHFSQLRPLHDGDTSNMRERLRRHRGDLRALIE